MSNPKVTVVMPVYNAEKYLRQSIESILNQSFTNFEFLIFNDGSTDASASIVQSYQDSRIHFINNQTNAGYVNCLNTGFRIAKGEYIARMDADDISLPERLAEQVSILDENLHIGLCSTNVISINENSDVISDPWWKKTAVPIEWLMLWENPIAHPSVMLRKSIIIKHRFTYIADCAPAEDYELWSKLVLVTTLYRSEKVLLHYRILLNSAFQTNKAKAFNQGIQSSNNLAYALTNKKVPPVHTYLTVYPGAMGEELQHFNYKEADKWIKLLLKSARKYWKWEDELYRYASKDAQKRLSNYLRKFPAGKKPKLYLKKFNVYLGHIHSFIHKAGKKLIHLYNK